MGTNGNDGIVPQSFRLAVQQLINNCGRHLNSSSAHVSTILADSLLNRQESTLNIVEEGINLLSTSSLFAAENALLSTFHMSLARCVRTLQYSKNDCTVSPCSFHSVIRFTLFWFQRKTLNLETVERLRGSGYTWNEIAGSLQVSQTTQWRCLNKAEYEIENFTDISDEEF